MGVYLPNGHKPIGKTEETLQNRYEGTKARLYKIENANYKAVSTWVCEFRKLLLENPGLENEFCLPFSVLYSPVSTRDKIWSVTDVTKSLQSGGGGDNPLFVHYKFVSVHMEI